MTRVRLIVFDLDETLVHATEVPLSSPEAFRVGPYFVYVRPFASELIKFCASHFEVAVWSSSSERYVEMVTEKLFGTSYPVAFSWAVSKCVQKVDPKSNGYVYIKDLRKALKHGYAADEIIVIDDSPEKLQRQPTRHLCLSAFTGDWTGNFLALSNRLRRWRKYSQLQSNRNVHNGSVAAAVTVCDFSRPSTCYAHLNGRVRPRANLNTRANYSLNV